MPDSSILIALSKALGVQTDYFLRQQMVDISNIEFRTRKLAIKKINAIKETVRDSVERYKELETFLMHESLFSNPIEHIVIEKADDVERAVEYLLDKWGLGINSLPNVIEMLEDKDIKVVEIDADEKFDGLSGWAGCVPFLVLNSRFTVERKRFTALHELGHLLLNFSEAVDSQKEKYCNVFAGAMLLPRKTLYNELGESRSSVSVNELVHIKELYGISIQAIMARAKDLGIISNNQYVRFRIWVNADHNHKKEIGLGEYKGVEQSSRFQQLLYRATAEGIISMSKAASLANVKLAQFRDEFIAI